MFEKLYGQDIYLDDTLQAAIAANGEAVLSDGVRTALQDIWLRLYTPYGTLFYDKNFGSRIHLFVKDENNPLNRAGLCAEVVRCLNEEPRIVFGTPTCEVLAWDPIEGITLGAGFELIDETHQFNLVFTVDSDLVMVINDVNPV